MANKPLDLRQQSSSQLIFAYSPFWGRLPNGSFLSEMLECRSVRFHGASAAVHETWQQAKARVRLFPDMLALQPMAPADGCFGHIKVTVPALKS